MSLSHLKYFNKFSDFKYSTLRLNKSAQEMAAQGNVEAM